MVAMAHGLEFRICRRLRRLIWLALTDAHLIHSRDEMLDSWIDWRSLERLEKRRQAWRLYCRALHHRGCRNRNVGWRGQKCLSGLQLIEPAGISR